MKKKELISIIVPCYNEEESIPFFYEEVIKLEKELKEVDFEYLFVDDGSKDKTLLKLRELAKKDKKVRYISFSRNFGKEGAMYAGLKESKGDYVVIIDADLQQPPSLIADMYKGITEEGYDIVGTKKVLRKKESFIQKFFARAFYNVMEKMSMVKQEKGAGDYRLMTRKVVNSILELKEYNRYTKGIFGFVGYKTKWIELESIERAAGETKWGFKKLLVYGFKGILSFSVVPLVAILTIGIIMLIASFIMFIIWLVKVIGNDYPTILGLSTLMVFLTGIIVTCMGIFSLYLSQMYLEIKNRPIYITKETEEKR